MYIHMYTQFPTRRGEGDVSRESSRDKRQCSGVERTQEDSLDKEIREGHILGATGLSHL